MERVDVIKMSDLFMVSGMLICFVIGLKAMLVTVM